MALAVNVKHYAKSYNFYLEDPEWYEKKPA